MRKLLLVTALCLLSLSTASARELAGVSMPDSIDVDGSKLALNGLGLRTKIGFKVYVAGLYVEKTSKDPNAILSPDTPRRIDMQFMRSVGREKIADTFRTGFEKNSKSEMAKLEDRIKQLEAAIVDLKEGNHLIITYSPKSGTKIHGTAKETTIPGKDFADALFRNWLGPNPADSDCKTGLLGG